MDGFKFVLPDDTAVCDDRQIRYRNGFFTVLAKMRNHSVNIVRAAPSGRSQPEYIQPAYFIKHSIGKKDFSYAITKISLIAVC